MAHCVVMVYCKRGRPIYVNMMAMACETTMTTIRAYDVSDSFCHSGCAGVSKCAVRALRLVEFCIDSSIQERYIVGLMSV